MTDRSLEFFVPGIPAPGGSKKAFVPKGWTRAAVTDAGGQKNKDWRSVVALAAFEMMKNGPDELKSLFDGPIKVSITFVMPRPKSHFNKKGLKPNSPYWHTSRPDLLKLTRSTEDAMTGVVWTDDSIVCHGHLAKIYGEMTGAMISVKNEKDPWLLLRSRWRLTSAMRLPRSDWTA